MQRALDIVGRRPFVEPADPGLRQARQLPPEVDDVAEGALPSFVGLSLRSAIAQANAVGVPVEFEGSGFVVEQLPLAGSAFVEGALRLRLEPSA